MITYKEIYADFLKKGLTPEVPELLKDQIMASNLELIFVCGVIAGLHLVIDRIKTDNVDATNVVGDITMELAPRLFELEKEKRNAKENKGGVLDT